MKNILKARVLNDIEVVLHRKGLDMTDKIEILDAAKTSAGLPTPVLDIKSCDGSEEVIFQILSDYGIKHRKELLRDVRHA